MTRRGVLTGAADPRLYEGRVVVVVRRPAPAPAGRGWRGPAWLALFGACLAFVGCAGGII